jgi:hypothetical protein
MDDVLKSFGGSVEPKPQCDGDRQARSLDNAHKSRVVDDDLSSENSRPAVAKKNKNLSSDLSKEKAPDLGGSIKIKEDGFVVLDADRPILKQGSPSTRAKSVQDISDSLETIVTVVANHEGSDPAPSLSKVGETRKTVSTFAKIYAMGSSNSSSSSWSYSTSSSSPYPAKSSGSNFSSKSSATSKMSSSSNVSSSSSKPTSSSSSQSSRSASSSSSSLSGNEHQDISSKPSDQSSAEAAKISPPQGRSGASIVPVTLASFLGLAILIL